MAGKLKKRNIILVFSAALAVIVLFSAAVMRGAVKYVLVPYDSTGSSAELEENEVSIESFDGNRLVAKEKRSETSHLWVILIHGYRADYTMMNIYDAEYSAMGYNVLMTDNRAHGKSGGKYIGMRYLDKYDILSWIDYIIAEDSEAKIVLHGSSMGAATALMVSSQEDLPDNVTAVISDSSYVSAESYLTWKLKQTFHLPSFPVIPLANLGFKIFAGYYMTDASALEAVEISSIPTLFIHGTDDQTVPVDDVYTLYDNAVCPKELYVAEGAGHGEAVQINKEEYFNRVFNFINIYMDF
ncbi:MAG: alpha/beta hydrolase [Eubacterium sp.]|nr:alpha/beta hydrolase [Eubacterium sp.]